MNELRRFLVCAPGHYYSRGSRCPAERFCAYAENLLKLHETLDAEKHYEVLGSEPVFCDNCMAHITGLNGLATAGTEYLFGYDTLCVPCASEAQADE